MSKVKTMFPLHHCFLISPTKDATDLLKLWPWQLPQCWSGRSQCWSARYANLCIHTSMSILAVIFQKQHSVRLGAGIVRLLGLLQDNTESV